MARLYLYSVDLYLGRCQGAIPPNQYEEQQNQLFCSDQKRITNIKSVHEELALQWVVATSTVRRDAAANNSRLNFIEFENVMLSFLNRKFNNCFFF